MLKLAFRNIFRQKGRTFFTVATIIFGVVGLILSGGFVEDIFVQLREFTIRAQLGHIQIYKAGYSTFGQREPYRYLLEKPEEILTSTSGWVEIGDVMMRLNFSGLANNGRSDFPIRGEGVEPKKEARLGSFVSIVEGRQLGGADTYGVLLGQGVARALKLVPGDYMTVLANTPDGALNSMEFQVVGVFRSFSKEYDERTIRISLAAAQDLIATEGVHSLVFLLKNTMKTDVVAQRLHDTLSLDSYEVKRWYELADFYRKTVDLYRRQFGILQIIISIMVLLTVANSVNMAIYERTGEFGTLQALGNTQGQVFRLILVEYSLLGLIGAGLGVILGVFLAWVISEIGISMPPPPNSDIGYIAHIRIVSKVVSLGFLVGFIATVLASLLPASRAARIPVVDALRANI